MRSIEPVVRAVEMGTFLRRSSRGVSCKDLGPREGRRDKGRQLTLHFTPRPPKSVFLQPLA